MSLAERVRWAGVVGAGGAGFPAHVKLGARADVLIANGAECEPLLHKDAAVMERQARELVEAVEWSADAVGAERRVIAIKAKNHHAVEAVSAACLGRSVEVKLLGDYYPAGDEYDLVHEVTGRLIPPGGLPLDVGCLVNNVETLVNIGAAVAGHPVIHKTLTVAGAVREPVTITAPIGTSFRECLAAAGGPTVEDPVLFLGGLMMGEATTDLDTPVTKTSTGVVVLPADHRLCRRKQTPPAAQSRIGKSACDQCRYCTEYCPRFLLGYAVEPHQVMRGLGFTATGAERWNEWAALCCSCGLCTLFACPEELFPKEACDEARLAMRRAGWKWQGSTAVKPHPMREGRRVPIQGLMRKLDVRTYDHPAPFRAENLDPPRVTLPWKQHAGVPCAPIVKEGDRVAAGQPIGEVPAGSLGARLHASRTGRVAAITKDRIILERIS